MEDFINEKLLKKSVDIFKILIDNIYVLRIRKNYIQYFWFSTENHIGDHYEKS